MQGQLKNLKIKYNTNVEILPGMCKIGRLLMIIYVNYCFDTLTTILRQYSNFAWPISQINLLVWESIFDQHKIM